MGKRKIIVTLKNGDKKILYVPFGVTEVEIIGELDDKFGGYGWTDYE